MYVRDDSDSSRTLVAIVDGAPIDVPRFLGYGAFSVTPSQYNNAPVSFAHRVDGVLGDATASMLVADWIAAG